MEEHGLELALGGSVWVLVTEFDGQGILPSLPKGLEQIDIFHTYTGLAWDLTLPVKDVHDI